MLHEWRTTRLRRWPRRSASGCERGRHELRWTLDQLAEAAGVSRRMVVNVEQGTANPSVGTLLRLGEALGVGLPAPWWSRTGSRR